MIRVAGSTRTNIKILEDGGRTTDVNLPGFAARPEDTKAVFNQLDTVATGDLVVVSGSQPQGLALDTTARLVADLAGRGARVVLDVSGEPLAQALAGAVMPHAVKPNRHELEALVGRSLAEPTALLAAARDLLQRLGALDGQHAITPLGRRMLALGTHPNASAADRAPRSARPDRKPARVRGRRAATSASPPGADACPMPACAGPTA